jgi:hypothetical protein
MVPVSAYASAALEECRRSAVLIQDQSDVQGSTNRPIAQEVAVSTPYSTLYEHIC